MAVVSSTGTIIEEVHERLRKFEAKDEDFYLTEINLGIRDIQNSFPNAPFLQTSADRTLSSGTRIYSAPTDFEKMNTITYPAGDVKLGYLHPEEFDILQPSASETGTPTNYTIRGQGGNARIEFYPGPGSSLTVHYDYTKELPVVSAASSTPEIPERYYELLVLFAEHRGLRRNGLYPGAREVAKDYEVMKERMKADLLRQSNENTRIRSVREFQQSRSTFDDPVKNMYWSNP